MNIDELACPHSHALKQVRESKADTLELFNGLITDIEQSDMLDDAKSVLIELLSRAKNNKSIATELIKVKTDKKLQQEKRNKQILNSVCREVALGCAVGTDGAAFQRAATRHHKIHGGEPIKPSMAKRVWSDNGGGYIEICSTRREVAALVAYYIEANNSEAQAIECAISHFFLSSEIKPRHRKCFLDAWVYFKDQTEADDIAEVTAKYNLP